MTFSECHQSFVQLHQLVQVGLGSTEQHVVSYTQDHLTKLFLNTLYTFISWESLRRSLAEGKRIEPEPFIVLATSPETL